MASHKSKKRRNVTICSEEWKPAHGLPGYEVSNLGRFRGPRGLLKPKKTRTGSWLVSPRLNGRQVGRVLAKIVLESFVRPFDEGEISLHGPAGRDDNSLSNLSIGTYAQNNGPDKWRDGTVAHGVRQGLCKLSAAQVVEIRQSTESRAMLAKRYGVCYVTIYNIQSGITHRRTF